MESFLGPLGRPLLSIVPYALCLMRSDPLLFEAKNSIHSIYKGSKLLDTFFSFGTFNSILAGLAKIEYLVHFNPIYELGRGTVQYPPWYLSYVRSKLPKLKSHK